MNRSIEKAIQVAPTDISVLVTGESGVGKENIPRIIHALSHRKHAKYIAVNCGAIPEGTIDSELFGHEKGSFTGALNQKVGSFEHANGGTIFLDEIGEMPPYLQTKLLRVLQEREYRPIGSDRVVRVDFRLICATNIDLETALREGKLREDLYFRINTITLRVPPVRERSEDIPLLCNHFLSKFNQRYQKAVRSISPAAYHLLIRNRWAGNVRELENRIKRAVIMTDGKLIGAEDLDLPCGTDEAPATINLRAAREIADRRAIRQAMSRANNNISSAAKLLGISRPTLYDLLKQYQLQA